MKTALRNGLFFATLISVNLAHSQTGEKLPQGSYIQKENKIKLSDNYRGISLSSAIEQALRKNYNQRERSLNESLYDLNWSDTWSKFWLPSLKLTLSTDAHQVARLWDGQTKGGLHPKRPAGSFGLEFEDYTIYNWGKDYISYLNNKATYLRSKEILSEKARELKHNTIIQYFKVMMAENVSNIRKEQLRQTSFVYRLNRERLALKKTTRNDYLLSRTDYLEAQTLYHQAKINAATEHEVLAELLDDPMGTVYIFKDELNYKLINTSLSESLRLAKEQNTSIKTAETLVENAKRSLDLARKENLPLPKFSVNLGAYKQYFGTETNRTVFRSEDENSSIEVVAQINASWSLTGEGGLFNSRATEKKRISKDLAFNQLAHANRSVKGTIRTHYKKILQLQNQITILNAKLPTLEKTYDSILENYINKKARYYDFNLTLSSYNESEILLEQSRYYHLKEKIELAKTIGTEDFPGENFENLAVTKSLKKESR